MVEPVYTGNNLFTHALIQKVTQVPILQRFDEGTYRWVRL